MSFDRSLYSLDQLVVLDLHLNSVDNEYGDISDIDPQKYPTEIMRAFTLSRGQNPNYGPIEDLLDSSLPFHTLNIIMLGRGSDPEIGNIDHLINDIKVNHLLSTIAYGLGSNPRYGDISNLPYLKHLSKRSAEKISLGLGNDISWLDISNVQDVWLLDDTEMYNLCNTF